MDDPWGSPWVNTDTDKDAKPSSPSKSTRSARSDLEPPPRAFLSSSGSPRIPAILAPSPWANDDDGFGDWARPQTPAQTQSGWGGGWNASNPNLASPPREDVFTGASPIAWPGNIALSKPTNGSILRQPSPDPWSAEFSPSIDGFSTPRLVVEEPRTPPITSLDRIEDRVDDLEPAWGAEDFHSVEEKDQEYALPQNATPAEGLDGTTEISVISGSGDVQNDAVRLSVESATQSQESPFSSPSGEDTDPEDDHEDDHEDDRQDSPITSVDEDAKTRHTIVRKTSGKVQQLVNKFDGLSRAASEEAPVPRREHSRSPLPADDSGVGDQTEFGDFEDADEDVQVVAATERPSTPRPAEQPLPESGPSTAVSSPQLTKEPATIMQHIAAAHGAVKFDVDTSTVEKLFDIPESETQETATATSIYIPDHIIDDSFTEISERKTWYRISRMGSSRKYNAGDDENYRLVTWPTSTIREDTIKVVRRWMEEDSIAGRVTLGGGISKMQKNMFGWDSAAEPVALDTVFRKKTHSRASSLQNSAAGPTRKVSSSLRSPLDRPSSVVVPPVATFGWSTNSPSFESPVQSAGIQPPPKPTATSTTAPFQPAPSPHSPMLQAPSPASPSNLLPSSNQATNTGDGDDDDDWGEMVSSPAEQRPSNGGFDNLDAAFTMPAAQTSTQSQASQPKSVSFGNTTHIPAPTAIPLVNRPPTSDPWAAADLSFFESTPKMAPPVTKPNPVIDIPPSITPSQAPPSASERSILPAASSDVSQNSGLQPLPSIPKPSTTDYSFTPTTPLDIRSPAFIKEDEGDYFKLDKPQADLTDAVRQIIANLPDLSYMLR